MVWQTPWGLGFPGWHIECSAMSLAHLGQKVDLHVGGIDLRFPHHENERAQSNALSGHETVTHWIHGEHLLFEGRKMSKSAGNVVLVQDVIDRDLDPLSARFAFLENRYRSQMDLTWASLKAADSTLKRWRGIVANGGTGTVLECDPEVESALFNDLDTPKALQRLRVIEKDAQVDLSRKRAIFLFADQVLGLDLNRAPEEKVLTREQEVLLRSRQEARSRKDFTESDRLRGLLEASGLAIHDGPGGQSWS
jgi:cysteinyl-tRNA synthetase